MPQRCTATYLQTLINTAMLFSAIYIILDMFREKCELCFFRVEYIDDLMQGDFELYTKSTADIPEPMQRSPTLVLRIEKTDKARAVKDHRRHSKAKDDTQ